MYSPKSINKNNAMDICILDDLITARDEHNRIDNFKPDWSDTSQNKWVIYKVNNIIMVIGSRRANTILAFKTLKTA